MVLQSNTSSGAHSGVLEVEMLPAREGDCILITYGTKDAPRRILIDGGRQATWQDIRKRFLEIPCGQRELELLVITHIDRDHIEGIVAMFENLQFSVRLNEVWYNGYAHLQGGCVDERSARQGETLAKALGATAAKWNTSFAGRAVLTDDDLRPPIVTLPGGMVLTLLSPNRRKLRALAPRWAAECANAGLLPGGSDERGGRPRIPPERVGIGDIERMSSTDFEADADEANGSSIAFLAEYGGRRILFGADAHVDRLIAGLQPLAAREPGCRIKLDALKVPHHASARNVSKELIDLIDCKLYLVSTNGAYFGHPDPVGIARILKFGGIDFEIAFNYESPFTAPWKNDELVSRYHYTTRYGSDGSLIVSFKVP
jgi:beta-lactamase superfamily II metal-dependent hydrolase